VNELHAIGPAAVADVPAIEALLRECGLPGGDVAAHIAQFDVARRDGAIVGSAGLEVYGRHALLRSVAVAPAYRGQGLGEALVIAAGDRARRQGVVDLTLLTTTAPGFFARLGFVPIARAAIPEPVSASPQVRGLCPASAQAMQRSVRLDP
jgi:amino-acid N-acetyltransferase